LRAKRFFRTLAGLSAGLFTSGLMAAPPFAEASSQKRLQEMRVAITLAQELDQRLQDVGWQLVRGNAGFCEAVVPSIGLQLQDSASYGRPDLVEAALGLDTAFAVQTAARTSPAARTRVFARNRGIARIEAENPNVWESGRAGSWQRLSRAHDWIDSTLGERGAVTITFSDGAERTVKAVPVCATRFEIMSRSRRAVSEGARVVIGDRFPAFQWEAEDEFAGVVAHELAHNLLDHRAWLERNGRKRRAIRLTEREADRLMPWLMANAGYDPQAAYRFMVRWGKNHDAGLFRARTHDGWDERAEFIAAEIPIVADLMKREGKADWSIHFRREIDPGEGSPEEAAKPDAIAERE